MVMEKFSGESSSSATAADAYLTSALIEDCLQLIRGETAPSSALMDDCLKLLGGGKECRRLGSLLLVTKLCKQDDCSGILQAYHAAALEFFLHLLRTSIVVGKRGKSGEGDYAYLELSVAVLASYCRVPQIAASSQILAVIPLMIQIINTGTVSSRIEDCYELLYLVANTQDGVRTIYDLGGIQMLASQMRTLPCNVVEYAMKIVQLMLTNMLTKFPEEDVYFKYPTELATLVVEAVQIFGLLHTDIKFKALHLLSLILSSNDAEPLHEVLQSLEYSGNVWSTNMKVGILSILNSPVPPSDKLHALILTVATILIVGRKWWTGPVELPGVTNDPIPDNNMFIQLVLETSRLEIAVLCSDLAYLRDETSKITCAISMINTSRNHFFVFWMLVDVIELIGDRDTTAIRRSDSKIMCGLEETVCDVLEYLQYAKDHVQKRGDALLASVAIIGVYFAKRPDVCREKVKGLLNYMISVRGTDEIRPCFSTWFLCPLFHILIKSDCELFVTSGAFTALIECIMEVIGPNNIKPGYTAGDMLFDCVDVLVKFLVKGAHLRSAEVDASLFKLVPALSRRTDDTNDRIIIMMVVIICAQILSTKFQDTLKCYLGLNDDDLNPLSLLVRKSFTFYADGPDPKSRIDQSVYAYFRDIAYSDYYRWANILPSIKGPSVERPTSNGGQLKQKLH